MAKEQWSVIVDKQQYGPADTDTLKNWIMNRSVTANTLVWRPGMDQWKSAGELPELVSFFKIPPTDIAGVGDETLAMEALLTDEPAASSPEEEEAPASESEKEEGLEAPFASPETAGGEEAPFPSLETAEEEEAPFELEEEEDLSPGLEEEEDLSAGLGEAGDLDFDILYKPSYSLLRVNLGERESLLAQPGAMISMSGGIKIKAKARGGFFSSLARWLFGGERFFMSVFTAGLSGGQVCLAPRLPGDISHHLLAEGDTLYIQSGSYLASTPDIKLDTKWGGSKSFFAGESLFLLRATGKGSTFLSSYGAIHSVNLGPEESYIIDTGHMVAFTGTLTWKIRKSGSLKAMVFSGEGLVCEFTGPGTIYLQTRNESSFVSHIASIVKK